MYIVLLGPGRDQGQGQGLQGHVLVHLRGPLGPDRDREAGDNLNRQKKQNNHCATAARREGQAKCPAWPLLCV